MLGMSRCLRCLRKRCDASPLFPARGRRVPCFTTPPPAGRCTSARVSILNPEALLKVPLSHLCLRGSTSGSFQEQEGCSHGAGNRQSSGVWAGRLTALHEYQNYKFQKVKPAPAHRSLPAESTNTHKHGIHDVRIEVATYAWSLMAKKEHSAWQRTAKAQMRRPSSQCLRCGQDSRTWGRMPSRSHHRR